MLIPSETSSTFGTTLAGSAQIVAAVLADDGAIDDFEMLLDFFFDVTRPNGAVAE